MDPEGLSWWRRLRHDLAWMVSTHSLRLAHAFALPPPPNLRPPPPSPLPSHDLESLALYFGLAPTVWSGAGLLLAAQAKCERVQLSVWRAAGPLLAEAPDEGEFEGEPEYARPLAADWVSPLRPSVSPELEELEAKLSALEAAGGINLTLMRKAAMSVRAPLTVLLQEAAEAGREIGAVDGRLASQLAAHYVLEATRLRHLQLQLLYCFNYGRSLLRDALPATRSGAQVHRHVEHGASAEVPGAAAHMLLVVDSTGLPVLYSPAVDDLAEMQTRLMRLTAYFEMPAEKASLASVHPPAAVAQTICAVRRLTEAELRFQLAKQPLLQTLGQLRGAARQPEDAAALAQLLADLHHQRVRVDLNEPDFREAYEIEVEVLRLKAAIVERVLGTHVQERRCSLRLRARLYEDAARYRAAHSQPAAVGNATQAPENCVDEATVSLFRELDAFLKHLVAEALAAVPKQGLVVRGKIEAVVLSQVLAVCDRWCMPAPRLPAAWAEHAAHAATRPLAVGSHGEQPSAATLHEALTEARRAAQDGPFDCGRSQGGALLDSIRGLPIEPSFVRLVAAQRNLQVDSKERLAAHAVLQLWPTIVSTADECEYLRGVLGTQTRQIEWRSWLDLPAMLDLVGSPKRTDAGGSVDATKRAEARKVLARGAQFVLLVRRDGANALLEPSSLPGARSLLHTLLAERRLLLVLIDQIASVRRERAGIGPPHPPDRSRVRRSTARHSSSAAAGRGTDASVLTPVYWPLPAPMRQHAGGTHEVPLANRTKLALRRLVSGLRERNEERRALEAKAERCAETVLLAEKQALENELRMRARRSAEMRATSSADAIASEAPQLVAIEGLRDALWTAQHELHACEERVVREHRRQYDDLLRELTRETETIGATMARNQAFHVPETRSKNAEHLARSIKGDKATDPSEGIGRRRADAESEHVRLLDEIAEHLSIAKAHEPVRFPTGIVPPPSPKVAANIPDNAADVLDAELRLKVRLRDAQAEHALIASRVEALHAAVGAKDEAHAELLRWKVKHVLDGAINGVTAGTRRRSEQGG